MCKKRSSVGRRRAPSEPSREDLAAIAAFAGVLSRGSTKFSEVLLLCFGANDERHERASQIDRQLRELIVNLRQIADL
jgi:hypothetical protein